jgi:hypothetical protein
VKFNVFLDVVICTGSFTYVSEECAALDCGSGGMEAVHSSMLLVDFCHTTQHFIPEDDNFFSYHNQFCRQKLNEKVW